MNLRPARPKYHLTPQRIYRLAVIALALGLLVGATLFAPPSNDLAWFGLFLALLAALPAFFPLDLLGSFSLGSVVALGGALVVGPVIAGWMSFLGGLLASVLRRAWLGSHPAPVRKNEADLLMVIFNAALPAAALLLAFWAGGWQGGLALQQPWQAWLLPVLAFAFIHYLLYLSGSQLPHPMPISEIRQDLAWLGLLELAPLPFVLVCVLSFDHLGLGTLLVLAGGAALSGFLLGDLSNQRAALARRLQQLTTLNQVSQALHSSMDLDHLLSIIHLQVSQALAVDNFYIALLDSVTGQLWYPLAFKRGQRQNWQPRPQANRLTDRVILSGEPILMARRAETALARIGLPVGEDPPSAWMGTPLFSGARSIGCLAVFSLQPEGEFTPGDLELLTILSGEVSVAIENAQLASQAKRQSTQLETINRVSALAAGSLSLQEVLAQVCRSISASGTARACAVWTRDLGEDRASLAYAHGLSADFTGSNHTFAIVNGCRARSLRTGQPELVADIDVIREASAGEDAFLGGLQAEGLRAYADFPLISAEGPVGCLSVFYAEAHAFPAEEVELLRSLAAQVALAITNARLLARTDLALARRVQQLSILESIGRKLAAAIASERVFEIILADAVEFTGSSWGSFSLYHPENGVVEVKAAQGYAQAFTRLPADQGIIYRVLQGRQPVYLQDASQGDGALDLTGGRSRSQFCLPLLSPEQDVLGLLILESTHAGAYSPDDQAFVGQLAVQAAVAVVNAQLFQETQRRMREQSILYQVSARLAGNLDIENILVTLQSAVVASAGPAKIKLYGWSEAEQSYIHDPSFSVLAAGMVGGNTDGIPGLLRERLADGAGPGPFLFASDPEKPVVQQLPEGQTWLFPILANRQCIGWLWLQLAKPNSLSPEDARLMQAIVTQAALSLENALLLADTTRGRDRMSALLNSIDEGVLLVESGVITLANGAIQSLAAIPERELLHQPFDCLPEAILSRLGFTPAEAAALAAELAQGESIVMPSLSVRQAVLGPEQVFERYISPVKGQQGKISGWMVVLHDVTDAYQMAQARELLTETLIHDLRSPISAVVGALDMIDEGLGSSTEDGIAHPDLARQAVNIARRGAGRVLGLIETLLDIARFQSGKMDLALSWTDLRFVVASVVEEFQSQAMNAGLRLIDQVPSRLPGVYADPAKLARILANLIDNAIKFVPAGGQVEISAGLDSPDIMVIQVSDTGPGIPEAYREKIFERFSQVPGLRGRRRGSGLGLTFCRLAVEAHGGTIRVEGHPGGGSLFIFTLPVKGPDNFVRL